MRRPRLLLRRFIIGISIVMTLLALVIWAVRPSPFDGWLGTAGGLYIGAPLSILRIWSAGGLAPMTPIGFMTLFPPAELFILGASVAALGVLSVLLVPGRSGERIWSWLTRPIPRFRLPRIGLRVRTAMILIAILALDLAWEIGAWKSWRLREKYRGQAASYASTEATWRDGIQRIELQRARLAMGLSTFPDDSLTPAARAARKAYVHDLLRRESAFAANQAAYCAELRRKYERAAADPSILVPPDPPPPDEREQPDPGAWVTQGKYARALAGYEELIRLYPDLVQAHQQRAWILATCPDDRIRDGKFAVAAATRAAELTNWKEFIILSTLAAAYAEAGDFDRALRWERRGMELERESLKPFPQRPGGTGSRGVIKDRLALYKAGKALRIGPSVQEPADGTDQRASTP